MSKLIDKLRGLFNPLGKEPESPVEKEVVSVPQEEKKEKEEGKDSPARYVSLGNFVDQLEVEETISDCLVREMGMYRGGTGYPDLTVWIDDPIAVALATPAFQDRLKKDLLHSGCRPRNRHTTVTVLGGCPPSGTMATVLSRSGKLNAGKVFMAFREETGASDKAVISVFSGKGSLAVPAYEIDPSSKKRYRIGRGDISTRPEYAYRVNDIVIRTEDPDENVQALNNHVSSAHADLVYHDGRFFLQVLPSGCSAGNNSTRIVRDQFPTSLDQVGVEYPLRDGDLIELGGTVLLEFKKI